MRVGRRKYHVDRKCHVDRKYHVDRKCNRPRAEAIVTATVATCSSLTAVSNTIHVYVLSVAKMFDGLKNLKNVNIGEPPTPHTHSR
jgi:hypothetical protein